MTRFSRVSTFGFFLAFGFVHCEKSHAPQPQNKGTISTTDPTDPNDPTKSPGVQQNDPTNTGNLANDPPAKAHQDPDPISVPILSGDEIMKWKVNENTSAWKTIWKTARKQIDEQKYTEADQTLDQIRQQALQAGVDKEPEWLKVVIEQAKLKVGLSGFETAVTFLQNQPRPKALIAQLVFDLYYAQSLVTYLGEYSYEIGQREKMATTQKGELKTWTRDQIISEIQAVYGRLFPYRESFSLLPLATFDYIKSNNYPTSVRGTLQDALSYFAVDFFGNTSYWTPEQENSIFELSLSELLQDKVQATFSVSSFLADENVHPLKKIVFILSDLESHHRSANHLEAALEARLERLRRLHTSFTQDSQKVQIRENLQALLPAYHSVSWWSMGQAQLTRFFQEENQDAQNLVKAHEEAKKGFEAYPDSIGGKTCLTLLKGIEDPDYSIHSMIVDDLHKRSIQISHKNIEKLYFRAYAVDLESRIKTSSTTDYTDEEVRSILSSQKPGWQWTESTPNVGDYKSHQTYSIPPMQAIGSYLIVASARPDFAFGKNYLVSTLFTASDLVILTNREQDRQNQVMVVSGKNGEPLSGVTVRLYQLNYRGSAGLLETAQTNEQGITILPSHYYAYNLLLLANRGSDKSVSHHYQNWTSSYNPEKRNTLIYTDRSIYRPMQKLFWKVVAYQREEDHRKYSLLPATELTIRLFDLNGKEVSTTTAKTNEFGSVAGEFSIPTGRALGQWRVEASFPLERSTNSAYVKVEEYKRPTFEVKFKEQTGKLRLNQPATFVGEARYYFGMPVTAGKAKFTVTRSSNYPWWWDYWGYYRGPTGNQKVASGIAPLKEDGTFDVSFVPKADEKVGKEVTYSYQVSADVVDEGGETRSANSSFQLGFVDVQASIRVDANIIDAQRLTAGTQYPVHIVRSNLNGAPLAGQGTWRLISLLPPAQTLMPVDLPIASPGKAEQDKANRTPGDGLRARWDNQYDPARMIATWKERGESLLGKGILTHNEKGEADINLPVLSAGAYRLYYQTKDAFGEAYETHSDLLVLDSKKPLALPVQFSLEKNQVKVGEMARFLVSTGFSDEPLYFELFQGEKQLEHRKLTPGSSLWIERKVTEEDRGGFWARVWMVRDYQFLSLNQSVYVPWDNKELQMELSTFRDKLKPGQKETWQLKLKDPKGKPLASQTAEILAYMYDRSLDYFGYHESPNLLGLFPSSSYGSNQFNLNVGQSYANEISVPWEDRREPWFVIPSSPTLTQDELLEFARYGIGGMGNRGYRGRYVIMAKAMPMAAPMARRAKGDEADKDGIVAQEAFKLAPEKEKKTPVTSADSKSASEPAPLRQNFSETAFWKPHLLTDSKGVVTIEFTVPDSVTSWNFLVRAFSKDFSSASLNKEVKTVKELLVRPYTPRFFREGDQATLQVMVNNTGEKTLSGNLQLNWEDPETHQNQNQLFGLLVPTMPFTVEAGKSKTLSFSVSAPKKVGVYALRAQATAGTLSDGELRPIPVLPSRMHLVQSKFVSLKNADKRTMVFTDLQKNNDPTRINEQLVVTLDAQLFATVLKALPYLVQYPYECSEQTLNRFLSTGIVTSVYKTNPSLAKLAQEFAKRTTQLETFSAFDPNRKMTLEETPWLQEAEGGSSDSVINVLNPEIAEAQRNEALARLQKMQMAGGGFPWFPGGHDSPYITLYLMHGFAKASEFQVEVPKDMVQRGWNYLARKFREDYAQEMIRHNVGWEFLTFLNYVASAYPDDSWTGNALTPAERKQILDFSFKHWREHSPYLKGFLALTLKRMGRPQDAKLVFDSVMDSAKTEQDQGTFWMPEDRSWLWYQDTIESHAFALRVLMELDPQNPKKDGLVLWLLLNKKLNQWKSTKATAEVIYSLVHYLKKEQALGIREAATVTIGSNPSAPVEKRTFTFDPEQYVGKTQMILPPEKINSQAAEITVEKSTKGFMFASATWHFSTDELPTEDRGDFFQVSRSYFKRVTQGKEVQLVPITEGTLLQTGDEVEVQLSIRSKHAAEYVHLRDPRGAGFEPTQTNSGYHWDLVGGYYQEIRDSGTNFFFEQLPQGQYTFKYRLRVSMAGNFRVGPATLQSMYAPEFTAYSKGHLLKIQPTK